MNFFVGVTDYDWFRFLAGRPDIDEVNFWQPSGRGSFKALQPGEPFLFKLHSPRNFIVGGGFFAHRSALPVSLAWEAFGAKNGAASLQEMRSRLAKYRDVVDDPRADYEVGCILLEQPFFLAEADWIPAPADWSRNIVRGKGYDARSGEGRQVWQRVEAAIGAGTGVALPASPYAPQLVAERFGGPTVVYPRLGQGSFRVLVTDIYDRRCAVTGERTLPVLQAAHIKPYTRRRAARAAQRAAAAERPPHAPRPRVRDRHAAAPLRGEPPDPRGVRERTRLLCAPRAAGSPAAAGELGAGPRVPGLACVERVSGLSDERASGVLGRR